MAIFGRRSARQRLRSAARESLTIPAFSAPVDCTSWVLGGLWPAELATITPDTAPLADYLNADLRRIANSANEKLQALGNSGLTGSARQSAEARVINVARAFAVLRVESTVRQLNKEALEFGAEFASLGPAPTMVFPADRQPVAPPGPAPGPTPPPSVESPVTEVAEVTATATAPQGKAVREAPEPADYAVLPTAPESDSTATQSVPERLVIDSFAELQPWESDWSLGPIGLPATDTTAFSSAAPPVVTSPPLVSAPAVPAAGSPVSESDEQRLHRLLAFVARQEPGVRWAIGMVADGTTRLVTDVAHGWIPPGLRLPAGVHLLEPDRRQGTASEMLGKPEQSAVYSPGDRLGWASDFAETETSEQPRSLANIDDLGWKLSEATHWREGLPRMANTLAKAGSAGTGVVEAEIDLLRVHLDTMRYQLLAQYPDSDAAAVLNCMLLAATEGIATGDLVSANYHFTWFRTLSAPPPSQWDDG